MGPFLQQMQKFNAKFRKEAFILEDDDVLEEHLHTIFEKSMSGIDDVTFSVSIDATRVPKDWQLSTSYKNVIGGAHPNYFISVEGKTKIGDINSRKRQDGNGIGDQNLCKNLQRVRVVFCPYGVLCGRPQTKKRGKWLQYQDSQSVREIFQYPPGDELHNFFQSTELVIIQNVSVPVYTAF